MPASQVDLLGHWCPLGLVGSRQILEATNALSERRWWPRRWRYPFLSLDLGGDADMGLKFSDGFELVTGGRRTPAVLANACRLMRRSVVEHGR